MCSLVLVVCFLGMFQISDAGKLDALQNPVIFNRVLGFVHGITSETNMLDQRRSSICRTNAFNVRASAGHDSVGGAAQKYLSKIPSHLQGIAIRNVQSQPKDYTTSPAEQTVDAESERIQKELDEDDENDDYLSMMDEYDETKGLLELDLISSDSLQHFNGDIDDALLLRDLRSKMDPSDFAKIFGNGVGDLL